MSEWRPIETIPADGTHVIVFCRDYGRSRIVRYCSEEREFVASDESPDGPREFDILDNCAGWMPQPEPPEEA